MSQVAVQYRRTTSLSSRVQSNGRLKSRCANAELIHVCSIIGNLDDARIITVATAISDSTKRAVAYVEFTVLPGLLATSTS